MKKKKSKNIWRADIDRLVFFNYQLPLFFKYQLMYFKITASGRFLPKMVISFYVNRQIGIF
jgi:hypothetical protein